MDSFNVRLPKIAPNVHRRARLGAWLDFHADVALRYIAAPPGSGKTTALVLYARSRPHTVGYVGLRSQTTIGDFYREISRATGLPADGDYGDLLLRLASRGRVEIIIDDVDRACAGVRQALQQLYCDVADSVTLVYLARSPEAIALAGGEVQGLVARCDPGLFDFRSDEIALYAQALGLDEDPMSIARLQRSTLGWATAVAGVCLHAAANGKCVRDSWAVWHRLAQRPIASLIEDALHHVPSDVAAEFVRAVAGRATGDAQLLRMFARFGLFVHEQDGRPTLNPLIGPARENDDAVLDGRVPGPAIVEMFGRFSFAIDGKELNWKRRRDRQLIAYLAMQPDGRATRARLISTFWPDADPQLAAQSLRTACSTIRRAFATCVGTAHVGRYFVAERLVELKLDAVVSSAARFQAHIAHADLAFDAGDDRAAYAHYAAAERLYISPLLAGEPPSDWAQYDGARLAQMHARGSERLNVLIGRFTSDEFHSVSGERVRSA